MKDFPFTYVSFQEHILDGKEPANEQERKAKQVFGNAQTTDWVGRTVAQLLLDPDIESKAGRVIWCHDVSRSNILEVFFSHCSSYMIEIQVAEAHGITDNDGTVVPSIRK